MFFFFKNNADLAIEPGSIEHAYLSILNDDLVTAKKIFKTNDSTRARWGLALIDILNGYLENYPTYFEIRNFLEIDLDFLLKNEKIDYVEHILGALEILADINQEAYKFAARVMFENKIYKSSKEYLDKSKFIFYNDPELHFMYAKYYMKFREYEKADFHAEECLKILPDYYPAKLFVKEISRYLV